MRPPQIKRPHAVARPGICSILILVRADGSAVGVLIAAAVVVAVAIAVVRGGAERGGPDRGRSIPRIISPRVTSDRTTRATCYGITWTARSDARDRVSRAYTAPVTTAVETSGTHAASMKAAAATSEPATTAAPARGRVFRDEAGADDNDCR